MSDVFAEATVQITPNTRGFQTKLEGDLKTIMDKVKVPPVRVRPALTRNFLGDLRTQVNTMIDRVQAQVKPIRIRVVVDTPSRRALAGLVQAPVTLPGVTGAGAARGVVQGLEENTAAQRLINRETARGIQILGLKEVAEDRATEATKRGTAAAKQGVDADMRAARVKKLVTAASKNLERREFAAATATGALAQEKKKLGIAEKSLTDLTEAATIASSKQAKELGIRARLDEARAASTEHLARVQQLQDEAAARGVAGGGATATERAAERARQRATDAHIAAGIQARAADKVEKALTKTTKDLAGQRELLTNRTHALADAERAVRNAQASRDTGVLAATTRRRDAIQEQVTATKTLVKTLDDEDKANKRNASSEKRRSEQLSRGGQASLLSLAGIRGATLAASRSFLVGAAAITVFARAVKQFADLERNLDVFRATTSATADQMEAVRKEATALGADLTLPAVSAGDAAGAMVELAKAGLSVQDSIQGARGVLELATAAAIDNADAVRLTANVLNAFNLSGREAVAVADTLANAANLAQGSIADIGTAFQQAASAGRQVGLSFQDTATFLTILAKNGLRGSDAGTSLRTALIRLVNPSKDAAAAFEKLGIVLRDAQGNIRPDVFIQIANATAQLAPAQRDATIALIGGQDAFRAVTILGRQSVSSFLAMRAALRQQGTAAELAKARTEGLHGALDGLQSVLETVGTNLASHVGPALADFVRSVASGITSLSENQQFLGTLNQGLSTTATSFGVLGKAIGAVGSVLLPFTNQLLRLSNAIGGAQLAVSIAAATVAFKAFQAVLNSTLIAKATQSVVLLSNAFLLNARASKQAATTFPVTVFGKVVQVETQAAASAGALARSTQVASAALSGLRGAGAVALAAIGGIPTLAIAAAGAIFFLAQRQGGLERATASLRRETDSLAGAFGRVRTARESLASAERGAESGGLAVQQARLNLATAQVAAAQSNAAPGTVERRQLLLNLAIATQDVKFATQDYAKALRDLKTANQEDLAASISLNEQRQESLKTIDDLIGAAIKRGQVEGVPGAHADSLNEEIIARKKLIDSIKDQAHEDLLSEDTATKAIGAREALIVQMVQRSKIPLDELRARLDKAFSADTFEQALRVAARSFGLGGKAAVDAFVKAVQDGLSGGKSLTQAIADALQKGFPKVQGTIQSWGSPINQLMRDMGSKAGENFNEGFKATISISDIVATATAQGLSTAQILARVQATLPGLQRRFNRLNRATKGGTVFKSQAQEDAFNAARDELNAANAEIERLTGEITQASKDAAQKVKDAQQKIDEAAQKQIDAITEGRRGTLLQRKITSAGLTAWLGDDLKTNTVWLNFLKHEKEILLARLKAAGASKQVIHDFLQSINNLIFETTNEIKRINADIAKNTQERRQAIFDTAIQKADLRIRIAQAQDNTAAELKARRRKLEIITNELAKLKNAGKKNTVAWLELKAEQAEEIAAIKDLTHQQQQKKNANAQLEFAFLQTLQGFTFNLLGNLIPGFATTGLLGNAAATTGAGPSNIGRTGPDFSHLPQEDRAGLASVGKRVASATTAAKATRPQGFTSGQGNTTNDLLRKILAELHKLTRGMDHPEAHHQRKQGTAALDYSTYGSGPQLAM